MPDTQPIENPCSYSDRRSENTPIGYCYYHMNHGMAQNNSKADQKRLFEVLLCLYNATVDDTIPKFDDESRSVQFSPLKAIGVSCTSSSSVGTADIEGVQSTYSNFVRIDKPIPNRQGEYARQFGAETLACTLRLQERDWLKWLFDSVAAPLPIDEISLSNPDFIDMGQRANTQLSYLQAAQLRQSMLQTFSSYAIQLMYNDGRDFVGPDGGRLEKKSGNVTAFVAGTVITPNVMPASVPIALFALWAVISSGLCLVYGFRRRWTAILDGHTVFRLGVELRDDYKRNLQQHSTLAEFEDCTALRAMPGFVGDVDHASPQGRIGLVDGRKVGVVADKKKFYR